MRRLRRCRWLTVTPKPTAATDDLRWTFRIGWQVWRPRRKLFRVRLDRFHDLFDCSLKLRVSSADHLLRTILHHNVRLHAVVLHNPFAIQVVAGELRPRNIAAIHQGNIATYAANAAPGA